MPRGPRLDSPGTLHHVIIRGIEKREIVADDKDRGIFVSRMGSVALKTGTNEKQKTKEPHGCQGDAHNYVN
ncbi:hypothetical protein [Chlorobium phaeobacteroides]|uniref:Uncharacterized protein n=1 Tax=Chlorobium phaeobacteroides (strain DSM 266 / SMG 266 / 2430) TaxID=290317 RepID=A1BIJ4_CHLPD|nr:hypothetical protein [Chlorobium phaeobacteroides]ABL66221.1 hypothetical protein Cpha266_2223 [Chlorobium phaeobacteroides DSM 266]